MNLKQLKYFVAVAEELHFGRAAQRLFISQPPLSVSIQQLEQVIGFNLFIRNNKNVSLTDAGQLFYTEALTLLKHVEQMTKIGERVALGTLGQIRIGFTSSMLFRHLDRIVHHFESIYPHINVVLKEMNSSEQLQALKQDQINIGFVHSLDSDSHLEHRTYQEERFVCCLTENHPLATAEFIDVHELKKEKFVLFPRSVAPHYHDQITAICVAAGFSPYISYEVRNWLTIVELVRLGLGIALVPASMQNLDQHQLRFIPMRENTIRSKTYVVWNKDHHSELINHFLESIPWQPCTQTK